MKISKLILLNLALALFFLTSCSSITNTYEETIQMPDVKINKENAGTKIIIDDSAFENKQEKKANFEESKKDVNQTGSDGSQITTMHDGYGNTVQTRYFYNHPNLKLLTVKTFADGTQEAIVFGHNGEKKKLNSDTVKTALAATGNEIAFTVGINTTKIQTVSTPYPVAASQSQPSYSSIPQPVNTPEPTPELPVETRTSTPNQEENPIKRENSDNLPIKD